MHDNEWLKALKVGDEVAVSGRYGYLPSLVTVSRITATQIVVGTADRARFRIKDGGSIGTGAWTHNYLQPATNELRARLRRASLLATVKALPWGTYSTSKLERIFAIAGEPNV